MALTNGNFRDYFKAGTPIFSDAGERVHMGTWIDKDGNKRDIRDIDHIAICNLVGERNPQIIREYSDTYLNTMVPMEKRLADRKRILSAVTGETCTITGFAQRLTFTREFIEALVQGVRATNLAVRVNTPLTEADFNNQRAVAGYAGNALLTPGQTFNQSSYGGVQGNMGFNGGGAYRY